MDNSTKKAPSRFLEEALRKADITSNLLPRKRIKAYLIPKQDCTLAGINYVKDSSVSKGCKIRIIKKNGNKVNLYFMPEVNNKELQFEIDTTGFEDTSYQSETTYKKVKAFSGQRNDPNAKQDWGKIALASTQDIIDNLAGATVL